MNLVGLCLLSVVAVLAFFKVGRRVFERICIKEFVLFLFVLALSMGILIPSIAVGENVFISIGGFIVPILFVLVMLYVSGVRKQIFSFGLTVLIVAALTVAMRAVIRPENIAFFIMNAVLTGLIAGAAAFFVGKGRTVIITGSISGIIIGDVVNNLMARFIYEIPPHFGGYGTFDTFLIAAIFGIVLAEIVEFVKARQVSKRVSLPALNFETSEDSAIVQAEKKLDKEIFGVFDGE